MDLGVDDIARASAFYAGLFGWDIQPGPAEAGGYTMCLLNGRPVAGIGPKQGPPGTPSVWTTYLAADNVDETAAKITKARGQLFMDPFDVMDVGRMVVAADPGGAVFGVWQARAHTGAGLANEPGTLCWNENHTRDFDRNKAFYQAAFGYELGDIDGAGIRMRRSSWPAGKSPGSWNWTPARRPGCPPTGRPTSPYPAPTPRWRRSARPAARSSARRGTPRTAGWPSWPMTRAPSSR